MRPTRVQLFHTCLVNDFYPEVGIAVVEVLEGLGLEVMVPPGQTCCGQPAYNAGFHEDARKVARHTLQVLAATDGPIVIPSGSCADMIVHQMPDLFRDHPGDLALVENVRPRCFEFSQFLVDVLGVAPGGSVPLRKVAYHASCHLHRGLGVDQAPRTLLDSIDGLRVVELPAEEECCGFGGMFAAKQPDISGAMMQRKLAAVESSGADTVVSCDLGCLMHLGGGLRRCGSPVKTCHLAELLARGDG